MKGKEKFESELDFGRTDESEAILQGDGRKSLRFYHWLVYDMRLRILYTTVLGILLGILLPVLIYVLVFTSEERPKYGVCLASTKYRFECLVNSDTPPSEEKCIKAFCCYDASSSGPRCHHSLPPAYQYEVTAVDSRVNPTLPTTPIVELSLNPRPGPTLNPFKVTLEWVTDHHFSLTWGQATASSRNLPVFPSKEEMEGNTVFDVSHASASEFFYVHVRRKDTEETVFDTRLGPVLLDETGLSISTVLPTPYFFGLRGGQGEKSLTYSVINAPGNMELPFYTSIESSGLSHGVLIETTSPFVFEYIEAPGVMFHFQGQNPTVKLHFFPGPSPAEVYQQLHAYLGTFGGEETQVPPYWSLGLHLCRRGYNANETIEDLLELSGETNGSIPIPYDSDCIDEHLRNPFAVNSDAFPDYDLSEILELLNFQNKRVILSQRIPFPVNSDTNGSVPLILNRQRNPLVGYSSKTTQVIYPDYLHPNTLEWVTSQMESLREFPEWDIISGLTLVDNFPETENVRAVCGFDSLKEATRLSTAFYDRNLVCPHALHENVTLGNHRGETMHLSVHNLFGQESQRSLRTAFEAVALSNERIPVLGASIGIHSKDRDGFSGLQVPFSWKGLSDSLFQILRHFMLLPALTGTPICGSFITTDPDSDTALENKNDLCLRWFQLGLLLPFARNTHEANQIQGPQNFTLRYREYLIDTIRSRYRLNPYYYTRFYESHLLPEPLIRPLFYDFHGSEGNMEAVRSILTQFMIGPALMAIPILSEATTREAYFPTGTWYDFHGNSVSSNSDSGITLTIPAVFSEIPVYIRSGSIIPTLNKALTSGNSTTETRSGTYTLLVTLPDTATGSADGSLFVDDGVSKDSISERKFDYVTFQGTMKNLTIVAEVCGLQSDPEISQIIDEINLLGFKNPGTVERIESDPPLLPGFDFEPGTDDAGSLRIYNLNLNWCDVRTVTFTWICGDEY